MRRRAKVGVLITAIRGMLLRFTGFASSLVLARLLVPSDFGLLAIGTVVLSFGNMVGDGGLGAALVRSEDEPTREQLQNVLGFQLAIAAVITICAWIATIWTGRGGVVTALIVSALPIIFLRTPGATQLERHMQFQRAFRIEIAETLTYTVLSVGFVALGAGVWGIAAAGLCRSVVGTVATWRVGPVGFLRPRVRWAVLRGLVAFGVQFQAVTVVGLLGALAVTSATGALGGLTLLGFWSLAQRLMSFPQIVFEALSRVVFPAAARIIAAGGDVARDIERGASLATVAAGFALVPLAASAATLIPSALGAKWSPVVIVIQLMCAGIVVSGPISTACAGYLWAEGRAGGILIVVILGQLQWVLVSVPMLALGAGIVSLGCGALAANWVDALCLIIIARRVGGLRVGRVTARPTLAAMLAGFSGALIARNLDPTLVSTAEVATGSLLLYILVLRVADAPALKNFTTMILSFRSLDVRENGAAVEIPTTA